MSTNDSLPKACLGIMERMNGTVVANNQLDNQFKSLFEPVGFGHLRIILGHVCFSFPVTPSLDGERAEPLANERTNE